VGAIIKILLIFVWLPARQNFAAKEKLDMAIKLFDKVAPVWQGLSHLEYG
jgi:hypothetical protein